VCQVCVWRVCVYVCVCVCVRACVCVAHSENWKRSVSNSGNWQKSGDTSGVQRLWVSSFSCCVSSLATARPIDFMMITRVCMRACVCQCVCGCACFVQVTWRAAIGTFVLFAWAPRFMCIKESDQHSQMQLHCVAAQHWPTALHRRLWWWLLLLL